MLTEIARKTILSIGRGLHFKDNLMSDHRLAATYDLNPPKEVHDETEANLVGSRIVTGEPEGMHAPAIDIDFPCYTIPSSTPGHAHLYFDRPLTWTQYKLLLGTLHKIGYIEDGYYRAAIAHGQTYLRLPGVRKEPPAAA